MEDWPNICGLLRISELCYFYSVVEEMFQKIFYSEVANHKKHRISIYINHRFLKIELVSTYIGTYLDKEQT